MLILLLGGAADEELPWELSPTLTLQKKGLGRRKEEELRVGGGEKDQQEGEGVTGDQLRGWREARGLEKPQVIWRNRDGNRVV